jgi:hypothetical protein
MGAGGAGNGEREQGRAGTRRGERVREWEQEHTQ